MPLLVTATQPTSKLDVGSYTVTCTGAVESVMENSQFDNPEIYRFYFDVHDMKDENGEQATTDAICSRKLSPSSKLWKFLTAFGMRPEIGKTFDLEECIGKTVVASVEPNKAGTFNNVAGLYPLPKTSTNALSSTTNTPAVDDAPFDTESNPLNVWLDGMKAVGFNTKEIIDLCKSRFNKMPPALSDLERDLLSKEYAT